MRVQITYMPVMWAWGFKRHVGDNSAFEVHDSRLSEISLFCQPKTSHSRTGGYFSEFHQASSPERSYSFCSSSLTSNEFLATAANLSSSTPYSLLKHLPCSGVDLSSLQSFLVYIFFFLLPVSLPLLISPTK